MSAAAVSAPSADSSAMKQTDSSKASPHNGRGSIFRPFGWKKDKKSSSNAPTSPSADSTPKIVSEKAPQLPELVSVPPMNTSLPPAVPSDPPSPKKVAARPLQSPNRSVLQPTASPVLSPRPTTAPAHSSPSPPRLSTSSSQIFERNVQEHVGTGGLVPTSPAIPSHIQTDNHIPPVLEASSIAITDKDCGVDEVQIVTSTVHQPAVSVVVPAVAASPVDSAPAQSFRRGSATEGSDYSGDETSFYGSGIGAAAAADKRRLSFISFADVVQAEQTILADASYTGTTTSSPSRGSPVHGPVDPIAISTITETLRRSPSPIRGSLGSSPPNAYPLSGSFASSNSPSRSGDNLGVERGELTIETMRQALRRTGSGELAPKSPGAGSKSA